MIVRTEALVRLPHLSRGDFQSHWREHHAPLVISLASALGIRGYKQLHSLATDANTDPAFDGFAYVAFESLVAFEQMLSSTKGRSAAKAIRNDERNFIDRSRSLVVWGAERSII